MDDLHCDTGNGGAVAAEQLGRLAAGRGGDPIDGAAGAHLQRKEVSDVVDPIVGGRIKELRKQAGLTQAQLAEELGCYAKDVCRWETGKYDPTIQYLKKLADVFGCGVDTLLYK